MNTCQQCGNAVYAEDKFCGQCGRPITESQVPQFMTQSEMRVEDVRSNLAMVYYKMGKLDQAVQEFNRVLESNPGDEKAKQMLEKIAKENGR